jgi:hypothetical protein
MATIDPVQAISALAAALSAVAAVASAAAAYRNYRLARQIHIDLTADERIIPGTPTHPALQNPAHVACVIQLVLFNKSARRAYVNDVMAFNRKAERIKIDWSNKIDAVGNTANRGAELIGIIDTSMLYIRTRDGKDINYASLKIMHSFDKMPLVVEFDPFKNWDD